MSDPGVVPIVPDGWKAKFSKRKEKYYYVNRQTSETQWDPPDGTTFESESNIKKKKRTDKEVNPKRKPPTKSKLADSNTLEEEKHFVDGETPGGTKQKIPTSKELSELFSALKEQKENETVVITGNGSSKLKSFSSTSVEEGEIMETKTLSKDEKNDHLRPVEFTTAKEEPSVAKHYSTMARETSQLSKKERQDTPTSRLRSHHNWIKNVLIGCATGLWGERATLQVLDLACGRGQDLFKWDKTIKNNHQSISSYMGIDIAYGAIGEATRRASAFHFPHRFECADLSNQDALMKMSSLYPRNSFHIASMQFALHYFFNREESIHNLFSFLASTLQAGGVFICTYADGNSVVRKLRDRQWCLHRDTGWPPQQVVVSNPYFTLETDLKTMQDLETSPTPFGHSYRFSLDGAVRGQREYLVPDDVLNTIANHYGFKTVVESNFQPFTKDVMKTDRHGHAMRYMHVFGNVPEIPHDEWDCSSLYKCRIMIFDPHNNRETMAKEWIFKYLFG